MKIQWPRRRKGCSVRDGLDQQWLIRFQRCGDFHAMAGAALFQNDGFRAEFRTHLRHGFGHIRTVK